MSYKVNLYWNPVTIQNTLYKKFTVSEWKGHSTWLGQLHMLNMFNRRLDFQKEEEKMPSFNQNYLFSSRLKMLLSCLFTGWPVNTVQDARSVGRWIAAYILTKQVGYCCWSRPAQPGTSTIPSLWSAPLLQGLCQAVKDRTLCYPSGQ